MTCCSFIRFLQTFHQLPANYYNTNAKYKESTHSNSIVGDDIVPTIQVQFEMQIFRLNSQFIIKPKRYMEAMTAYTSYTSYSAFELVTYMRPTFSGLLFGRMYVTTFELEVSL